MFNRLKYLSTKKSMIDKTLGFDCQGVLWGKGEGKDRWQSLKKGKGKEL
jgi:hypothetical protein